MKNLLLLPLLLTFLLSNGQKEPCGSTEAIDKSIQENPQLQKIMHEGNAFAKHYAKTYHRDKANTNIVIPVVVHIIHQYGSENLSKAAIEAGIKTLNERFQKTNADSSQIVSEFADRAADVQVEFRLARRDPNGNCTEGITRTVSNLTNDAFDDVKNLVSWNTRRYLNIWVAKALSLGPDIAGYAYFPGVAPTQSYEGVVMRASSFNNSWVLAHEVGHYLNLQHTWGSGSINSPNGCNVDDGVNDTPNTTGANNLCNLNQETCGSLDNVQNIMDYTDCGRMFTEGQKTRMHAALNSATAGRNNLWTADNLNITGVNGILTDVCKPVADFVATNYEFCSNDSTNFIDMSYNAHPDSMSWSWSFPGGTPSTSSVQNPTVVYKNSGVYDVTLTASTEAGNNSITKTQQITVKNANNGEEAPFLEGIENAQFPKHPSEVTKDWEIDGPASSWTRTTEAAASGDASIRIFNFPSSDNLSFLTSPTIDLSNSKDTKLNFKIAFAQRNTADDDELRVFTSTNCGKSWSVRYIKSRSSLVTNGGELISGIFKPTSSEWRQESISLSSLDSLPAALIRFQMASGGGNYLYVDDINISSSTATSIEEISTSLIDLNVFPNPLTENSILEVQLEKPAQVAIKIVDVLGNVIADKNLGKVNGLYQYAFFENMKNATPGIYFLNVTIDNQRIVRKIVF